MPKKVTKTESTTDTSSIEDRIKPAKDYQTQLSMVVYGRSGTGKTAFAGTWPTPALVLDIREKGTETISNVEGIEVIRVESGTDLEQIYWYLKGQKTPKYKSIIIDQISNLQTVAMDQIRHDEGMKESDVFSKRNWGQVSGWLQTWIFNYRDLVDSGYNVLLIAHERSINNDNEVEDQIDPVVGPRLMPSVVGAVNGAVSVIGHTFIREKFYGQEGSDERVRTVEYAMRLGPHAYYTTKVRQPKEAEVPDSVVNPTFEKIMAVVRGQPLKKSIVKKGVK